MRKHPIKMQDINACLIVVLYLLFLWALFKPEKQTKIMGQLKTKSYDEIVQDATSATNAEKKNEQLSRTARLTAKNNLSTARNNAEIKVLQAEDNFTAAVVAGTNIAETALALKSARETQSFYNDLFESLFPASQRDK